MNETLQIVGRSSSLFTRIPRMVAEELSVQYSFEPVYNMNDIDPRVYASNPALKLPILRTEHFVLFGALNICRAIAERAPLSRRIVWPEELSDDVGRNAQELVWHCAAAQVQLVMGTVVNKLPAENPFFVKIRVGLANSLAWLNNNLESALHALPLCDLSVFEVSLHCLIEHLMFRPSIALDSYPLLIGFAKIFSQRPAAQLTVYSIDVQPGR